VSRPPLEEFVDEDGPGFHLHRLPAEGKSRTGTSSLSERLLIGYCGHAQRRDAVFDRSPQPRSMTDLFAMAGMK
jgi:hypothetical protein